MEEEKENVSELLVVCNDMAKAICSWQLQARQDALDRGFLSIGRSIPYFVRILTGSAPVPEPGRSYQQSELPLLYGLGQG